MQGNKNRRIYNAIDEDNEPLMDKDMRPAHFIKDIERRSLKVEEEKGRSKSGTRGFKTFSNEELDGVHEDRKRILDPHFINDRTSSPKKSMDS